MKTLKIRKSIQSDILPIAHNMREDDVKEIWDSHLLSPYKALKKCLEIKGESWTIILNGVPIGMVGVSKGTLLSDMGRPWLLGTKELITNRRLFLIMSKRILKVMKRKFKSLENYVPIDNKASLRWLKKLGFTIAGEIKGITGVTFKRFYMNLESK